jgi:hypothetical protein
MALRLHLIICSFLLTAYVHAQTLGGHSVFNFLKLSNTPQLTALGGMNVSQPSNDVGLAFNNPSLLQPNMHSQLNAVFNNFYAGIKAYHLSVGYHHEKSAINLLWGLSFFDYGQVPQTDASGNIWGNFRPNDWVMQVSASRQYMQKWNYGTTLKFISSNYGLYRSSGLAIDAGLLFKDSARLFSASALVKNLGFQIKKYPGTTADDLPFDLQVGLTKKLRQAPFSFSVTAHHLHQFDIRYLDTTFNHANGWPDGNNEKISLDKIFRHFVFAATIYIGNTIEVITSYNYLRRKELSIGNATNGLTGFSLGVGAIFNKIQIRYARSLYQNNIAYNQLGINLKLNEYFGLGKFGERIKW